MTSRTALAPIPAANVGPVAGRRADRRPAPTQVQVNLCWYALLATLAAAIAESEAAAPHFALRRECIYWRGPLPGCAVPALEGLWSAGSGPGEPKPARAAFRQRSGRAASFAGSGPSVGIPRHFAPTLPAVQTARLPRDLESEPMQEVV